MPRTTITAERVRTIERLLAEGIATAEIAEQMGVTEFVVGVIAGDEGRETGEPLSARNEKTSGPTSRNVEAASHRKLEEATIRRVERMLEVGHLPQVEIAREAGVSISQLKRIARQETSPTASYRCHRCGTRTTIAPCLVCRARSAKLLHEFAR